MAITIDDTNTTSSAAAEEMKQLRRGRRPSTIGRHHISSNYPSSSDTSSNAISFEASPTLYFSEVESLIDLNDSSSEVISYDTMDLVVDRVQSRLLQKHIKSGRLISAFSAVDVRSHNKGRSHQLSNGLNNQRRIRSTLSFASNMRGRTSIATRDLPNQVVSNRNE